MKKHFMQPKSDILRENNNSDSLHHTNPNNSSIKKRQTTMLSTAAGRKQKLLKENLQDAPSSTADPSHCGRSSSKIKSGLPPRPNSNNSNTLKRKLIMEPVSEVSVQAESDSGVKVVVRMRPHRDEIEGEPILQKVSPDSLSITGQAFSFDSVEDINATQLDIFKIVGDPVVEHCLSGFNSSVFAYGQTGSGKTYTMWGPNKALLEESASSHQQGITPRILERLFIRINEQQTKYSDKQLKYQCRCSFLEIYNEQITDLLDPRQKNLQIREDVKNGVYVENLTEEVVCTMANVTQILIKGLSNRRTSATVINTESSRSHSVFTCVVESRCKSVEDGMSCLKTSRINLVDLAGSERQKFTGAAGERLKEAGNINKSLSQLGNLINILAEVSQTGKQRHIPYRDSKLTFLLQESLGGNAKLTVICAVSPSEKSKNETLSTLRFAQRAKAITNRAVVNEVMQDDVNILREVIRHLKDELLRMKTSGSTGNGHGNYSTGWNARRSLNLLKFSLSRPTTLPHIDDDSDEEMEIIEDGAVEEERTHTEAVITGEGSAPAPSVEGSSGLLRSADTGHACTGSPGLPFIVSEIGCSVGEISKEIDTVPVPMESPPFPTIDDIPGGLLLGSDTLHLSFARMGKRSNHLNVQPMDSDGSVISPTKRLAASLQCGLQVLERCSRGRSNRSSFRFPLTAPTARPVINVGVQTLPVEVSGVIAEDKNMCSRCNTVITPDETPPDVLDMQLVPVDQPLSDAEMMSHVPKAVEKVLAGSIRRELALQDICSKQASEITHLNHLIQQYKQEKECDEAISRIRDDKIVFLESLAKGILPAGEFLSEELISIRNEHKILKEKYESNPEVQMTQIELSRARDDLEKYQNFFDLGEREVLTEEIDELKGHLLYYVSPTSSKRRTPSPPPLPLPPLAVIPEAAEGEETEEEGGLVSEMAEELRQEKCVSEKLRQDVEAERKCSEELEEAMRLAMEVHARLLEQYAELEEKHAHLLARHRSIQDGIFDVKKAASKAGVRDPDSRFITALAAEISLVKAEREKERRYLRDENRGLQAQLRDTAEALQAAGELLVRLKEAEEATHAAEKRAGEAEAEMRRAYKKLDKVKRKKTGESTQGGGDGSEKMTEAWFIGHDRCNI